jgi:hypothetical protein
MGMSRRVSRGGIGVPEGRTYTSLEEGAGVLEGGRGSGGGRRHPGGCRRHSGGARGNMGF